jgi:hypothetical protein
MQAVSASWAMESARRQRASQRGSGRGPIAWMALTRSAASRQGSTARSHRGGVVGILKAPVGVDQPGLAKLRAGQPLGERPRGRDLPEPDDDIWGDRGAGARACQGVAADDDPDAFRAVSTQRRGAIGQDRPAQGLRERRERPPEIGRCPTEARAGHARIARAADEHAARPRDQPLGQRADLGGREPRRASDHARGGAKTAGGSGRIAELQRLAVRQVQVHRAGVGPRARPRSARAARVARKPPGRRPRPGAPGSRPTAARRAPASWVCATVCGAPTPWSSGGRSAVSTSSGMADRGRPR